MVFSPRVYYLFPAYPVLFAAGRVAWKRWLAGARVQRIMPIYVSLMVLIGALLAPTPIPLLPPETAIWGRAIRGLITRVIGSWTR
jgi:hypothetical protein